MKIQVRGKRVKIYGQGDKVLHKTLTCNDNAAAQRVKAALEATAVDSQPVFKPDFEKLNGVISVEFTDEYTDCVGLGLIMAESLSLK